jgi:hypothetical protein
MSYSFSVTASTKEEVTRQIREQFDAVALSQPEHLLDKEAVVESAQRLVRILDEPSDTTEIYVSVYGSLGWNWSGTPENRKYTSVGATVNAVLRSKADPRIGA